MIVADTHGWIWWLTDRTMLSKRALSALDDDTVAVSPVTFLEVATLARKGRITLNQPVTDWLQRSLERSNTHVVDLTLAIAVAAGSIQSDVVNDPADRVIIATALHTGASLVTKDRRIIAAALVPTIW